MYTITTFKFIKKLLNSFVTLDNEYQNSLLTGNCIFWNMEQRNISENTK